MFGELLGVLAVVGFWALLFAIVFSLVRWISVERDDEALLCELPKPIEQMGQRAQSPMAAQA